MTSTTTEVNTDAIPDELKQRPQWFLWRYETRDGKPQKVPKQLDCLTNASSTDAKTWSTFQEVTATYTLECDRQSLGGIAYVFAVDDPFFGVDLDACRDPQTGNLTDWANKVVKLIDSYTEISPSGYGVKTVARGAMLPNTKHVWKPQEDKPIATFGTKNPKSPSTIASDSGA